MNESNASSTMDLSLFSDESNFQPLAAFEKPDQPKPEKRKRGRPRTKPIVPVLLDEEGNPIKKQRGRPRKNPESNPGQKHSIMLFDESGAPLKKQRGRPRKSLIDPSNLSFTSETLTAESSMSKDLPKSQSKNLENNLASSVLYKGS